MPESLLLLGWPEAGADFWAATVVFAVAEVVVDGQGAVVEVVEPATLLEVEPGTVVDEPVVSPTAEPDENSTSAATRASPDKAAASLLVIVNLLSSLRILNHAPSRENATKLLPISKRV